MAGREGHKRRSAVSRLAAVHVRVRASVRLNSDDGEAAPLAESSFFRYRLKRNVT